MICTFEYTHAHAHKHKDTYTKRTHNLSLSLTFFLSLSLSLSLSHTHTHTHTHTHIHTHTHTHTPTNTKHNIPHHHKHKHKAAHLPCSEQPCLKRRSITNALHSPHREPDGHGLVGAFFPPSSRQALDQVVTRIDPSLSISWGTTGAPTANEHIPRLGFRARWTGLLRAPAPLVYIVVCHFCVCVGTGTYVATRCRALLHSAAHCSAGACLCLCVASATHTATHCNTL